MCITLKIRDDYTLNQLIGTSELAPVVKTPHVGNNSPNNLLAAKCGFPIVWVDATIPKRDKNANPHLLIRGGEAKQLTEEANLESRLSTHVKVTSTENEVHGFRVGESLIEGHLSQMRRVFPKTQIETAHQRFARHGLITELVMAGATRALPSAWYRRVDESGSIESFPKEAVTGVASYADILDTWYLPPRTSGWVVPNVFAILHDIVVQVRESGLMHVYMLSGPDMVKYLPSLVPQLSLCYQEVAKDIKLPYELTIYLVPFTDFKFTVRKEQRDACDALVRATREPHLLKCLREEALACGDIFTKTERRNYFTQHDMQNADDLYAPEELYDVPLRVVRERFERIKASA